MGWDKGIDFATFYNILRRNALSNNPVDACYSFILLIQLRNGSRISEAIDAFKQYILTRKTEIYVKTRKKRKEDYRLMIIPEDAVPHVDCSHLITLDDRKLRDRVRKYIYNKYKINTHSLRYSFITYLLKNNVNVSIIAKITHHSNLNYILRYTQQKIADEVLRSI